MRKLALAVMAIFATVSSLYAQCDPWISKAYNQIYGRAATAAECNIKNYNNGTWGSYPELVEYIAAYNNNKPGNHLKGDQWIFRAYAELFDRAPFALELNTKLYNNGSWNNYNELKGYIKTTQENLQRARAIVKQADDMVGNILTTIEHMGQIFTSVVSANRGEVKAKGGKAALAFASEALKKVAKAKGIILKGTEGGFAPSAKYVTLSAGSQVVATSGNGGIVFEQ